MTYRQPITAIQHTSSLTKDQIETEMNTRLPAADDVRMRGFAQRSRVIAAWQWIDAQLLAATRRAESVPVDLATGRVLASPAVAAVSVPDFVRSAMDGYALRGSDTVGATDYSPIPFTVVGESLAGRACSRHVLPRQAVRIMTGAPLPVGADAVLPVEFTNPVSGSYVVSHVDSHVEATAAVPPGKNVSQIGDDIRAGSTVLPAQRRLRPQDAGLLAAIGVPSVSVFEKPRVRILVTGTEIVRTGSNRQPFQIFDSNSPMLCGLVERDGGTVESVVAITDDRDTLRNAISQPGCDVLLISGGSSVGAEDHAPMLIAELGVLSIHGIAMRPSSPAGMGKVNDTLVFLLPGNPVSCLCAYDFFAGRTIRGLAGFAPQHFPYPTTDRQVGRKIVSAVGRVDYVRVSLDAETGFVSPIAISGASLLSSTTLADGFVVVPEELEGYGLAEIVRVFLYDPL